MRDVSPWLSKVPDIGVLFTIKVAAGWRGGFQGVLPDYQKSQI
jgi:hypothetical protein